MTRRTFRLGILGWVLPGLVALPLSAVRESAGGESALLAVIVWVGLGTVGCLIAGARAAIAVGQDGNTGDAFLGGLGGVATSWIAAVALSVAIELMVRVLHLGAVAFVMPIPFLVAYGIGFGATALARRR